MTAAPTTSAPPAASSASRRTPPRTLPPPPEPRRGTMLIENEFTVAAPIDFVWNYLLDVERIAPCMPGAELTEVVDDRNWKGKLNAKFGPGSVSFGGPVTMESRDDEQHRVVLRAK